MENVCIVRLKTEMYYSNGVFTYKKTLRTMKKLSQHYLQDLLEDVEDLSLILGLHNLEDGLYLVQPKWEDAGYYSCGDGNIEYITLTPYKEAQL